MESSDDEYEMLHATAAETAQWKKLEEQKKLWKIQTNQLEVLKVREKVISEMQENDCFQRELLKKKDEENAQLKRTIEKMQSRIDEENGRREDEIKLIDSMTGMLEKEMDWMDRRKETKQQLAPDENNAGIETQSTVSSIANIQCDSFGCANGITIINSAFICVTCSLLGNLISIVTSIVTTQNALDATIHGDLGEAVTEKQEEAMVSCVYLLADIISLLSFITHCPYFLVGKVVVEVLRLHIALVDDDSLAIDFHIVCLAMAVLWWRRMKDINAQLKAAREQIEGGPAAAAKVAADSTVVAA